MPGRSRFDLAAVATAMTRGAGAAVVMVVAVFAFMVATARINILSGKVKYSRFWGEFMGVKSLGKVDVRRIRAAL